MKIADDREVLAYMEREAKRDESPLARVTLHEPTPLGGLKLDAFRIVRDRLAREGKIVRTDTGRWVPAN